MKTTTTTKTIRTMMTLLAAGIFSTTFVACNKDKYTPETMQTTTADANAQALASASKQAGEEVSVDNEFQADFSGTHVSDASLTWDRAFCSVNAVRMHAILPGTGAVKYESEHEKRHMDLTGPHIISKIVLPYGEYKKIKYTVNLAPSAEDGSALHIGGTYIENGKSYRVRFMMMKPVEIKTQEKDVAVFDRDDHVAAFTLNIKSLSESITPEMLHNATKQGADNMIFISEEYNTELYNAIVKNLDKSCKVHFKG